VKDRSLLMGCVADDFTGASDAASFLAKGGLRTLLLNGVPDAGEALGDGWQAVVIALKTRTMAKTLAVGASDAAASWLRARGAGLVYEKYCSTFDSTREGNIGPISDRLLEASGAKYSIICPALPVNKRTVSGGHLFVDGVPLHESSMKDHPLTPMWDSDLEALMGPQSKYACFKLGKKELYGEDDAIRRSLEEFGRDKERFYVIPDCVDEADSARIVQLFGDLPLLTGGSGLMGALAAKFGRASLAAAAAPTSAVEGRALILAGSCSKATLEQTECFKASGGSSLRLSPFELLRGTQTLDSIWDFIEKLPGEPVLIYSFDKERSPEETRELGQEKISELLEGMTSRIAEKAIQSGFARLIVAGGETSGAVTKALGFSSFEIGESVAPGVPIMAPTNRRDVRLVLKSGNFGDREFFLKAVRMTGNA